ncbi:MAG: carbohydrate ABC transporter permease [Firmicutes bacterium]|nr:carbohydrate ABC transporter permease [Bacillota bacterium]
MVWKDGSVLRRRAAWRRFRRCLLYAVLILIAVGQLFPLIWLLDYSLLKSGDLFGTEFLKLPDPPQWGNYVKAWTDGLILPYFINSVIVAGAAVLLTVLCAFMLAFACTRMQWRLSAMVYGFVMLGMMIPIHATLLPNFQLFNGLGMLDTYWSLIVPYVAFNLPFSTLVFTGFLKTIPRALEESALIDGCTIWGAMFKIVAPITKPALVTVSVMTFVSAWNEFIMANTYLSSDRCRTLPFSVIKFIGYYTADYATQFACMMLVALPILVVYAFLNRYITEGATMGAIRG